MSEILTHVIRTEPLQQQCPREHLGLTCLKPLFACTCKDVVRTTSEIVQDTKGPVLYLTCELSQMVTDWSGLRDSITLTGLRSEWRVHKNPTLTSGLVIVFVFELWRPENASLAERLANMPV